MFSDLWNNIKELANKMLPKHDIENVLHIQPIMSDRMADAIQLWSNLYENNASWLREPSVGDNDKVRVVSLGLPSLIASEKARMVTLEMKSEVTAPMAEAVVDKNTETDNPYNVYAQVPTEPVGSTERAEFINKYYTRMLKQIRKQLEYGIAKGGLVIKPYPVIYEKEITIDDTANNSAVNTSKFTSEEQKTAETSKTSNDESGSSQTKISKTTRRVMDRAEFEFDFVQADRFFPLSFDPNGRVVEAAFVQTKTDKTKNKVYIRLEYHKLVNRKLTVQNLAFESTDMNLANTNNIRTASNLGNPIPLSAVSEWAKFEPEVTIEDVDRPLFAYFRMPEANIIDPYSPLGVSGYSRAVNLIKDADMQYSRMLWEFEGGELAIDVDRDALKFITDPDSTEYSVLPKTQDRLFRKVDLNNEETYKVFSPALRDVSLAHGLNIILMRIEDACGLSRGTLSDVTSQEAKTATELKILKQRSFATNTDIQQALQDALEDVVYIMDAYCSLYELTPYGEYETSFEWDDSIIVDSESELTKRITLMQNGLAGHVENRMWYFGETENQAKAALEQIEQETQQSMLRQAEFNAMQQNMTNETAKESGNNDPADTTKKKVSKGKQADNLDNPDKSKLVDQLKDKNSQK